MPSPPRQLKRSPPRKPLHDRSESSTNERSSPTVRLIGDPHAQVYSSTPFPTHPSHVLAPTSAKPSGAVHEDVGVSEWHGPANVLGNSWAEEKYVRRAKSKDTVDSDEENIGFYDELWPLPLTKRSSPTVQSSSTNEPNYNANGRSFIVDQTIEDERQSDEIVQLPSVATDGDQGALDSAFSILNADEPSYSQQPQQQPVVPKSSDGSISSAGSTGTVIKTKLRDRPNRASYSAFPYPSRSSTSKSNIAWGSATTPLPAASNVDTSPVSPVSPVIPASPEPSSVQPLNSHRVVSLARSDASDGVNVQYPLVRPPTASGSWAETSENAQNRPSRNPTRNTNRWNPHLSTVESEGMTDRSSGSTHFADSLRTSRAANSRAQSPPLPVFPRSVYAPQRNAITSTIRMVNERDDVGTGLAPVPGSRSSARFSMFSGHSNRDNQRTAMPSTRPSSRGSFFRDSIPGWAR